MDCPRLILTSVAVAAVEVTTTVVVLRTVAVCREVTVLTGPSRQEHALLILDVKATPLPQREVIAAGRTTEPPLFSLALPPPAAGDPKET